jgi:uncharacterized protein (DUF58 family)
MSILRFPRRTVVETEPGTPLPHQAPVPRTAVLDEDQLRYLQRMTFASGKLTSSGLTGEHRSRRRGPSPEFADFKSYSPGDDFRRIDWNTYARLDQLFIKESETTTEHDIHIFVDGSPSMDWSSREDLPTKLNHTKRLTSLLGYVAIWHFDRLSVQMLGVNAPPGFGPAQGRSNILRLLRYCDELRPNRNNIETDSIHRHVKSKKRPGRMVILSDFHWTDPDQLRETLGIAAARRWQTTLILVEDPAESDPASIFDENPHLELEDAEARARMHVSGAGRSIESYREAHSAWISELEALSLLPGVTFLMTQTSDADASAFFSRLVDLKVIQR